MSAKFLPDQKVKIVSILVLFLDLWLCVLVPIVIVNEQYNFVQIYKGMNVPGGLALPTRWFFAVPPVAYYALFAALGIALVLKEVFFKDGWRMLHVNGYTLLAILLFWLVHTWAMLMPMQPLEKSASSAEMIRIRTNSGEVSSNMVEASHAIATGDGIS